MSTALTTHQIQPKYRPTHGVADTTFAPEL